MNLLYILSFVAIVFVLTAGFLVNQNSKKTFEENQDHLAKSGIAGKELANKLILQNNLKNINVVNLKSKHTNYYSAKYNVLKFDPEISKSSSLLSLAMCAYHTNHAKSYQKHTFLNIIKTFLDYIFKAIFAIFIPLVLICAIVNKSSSTHAAMFTILFALIFYCFAFLIEFLFFLIDLKSTKSCIKDLKLTECFDEEELKILNLYLKSLSKNYFFLCTRWTLKIFWFISPDFIFRRK